MNVLEKKSEMKSLLQAVNIKVDKLEGHSRRNNLRFRRIEGNIREDWHTTENKVREFIRDELSAPDLQDVNIERAHGVQGGDPRKCGIIIQVVQLI